jgi:hypothetical protein
MPRQGNWKQCKAKSKATGERCRQPVIEGFEVCHYHGGKTPVGPAAHNFRTGRHSRWLPHDWLERYQQAIEDEDLLDLRPEIALVDAQIADVLERMQDDRSMSLWSDLLTAWTQFMAAARSGADPAIQARLANEVDRVIGKAGDDIQRRRELNDLIHTRRRMVETAQRVVATSDQMIAIDVMLAYMAMIVQASKNAALEFAPPDVARKIIVASSDQYRALVGESSVMVEE